MDGERAVAGAGDGLALNATNSNDAARAGAVAGEDDARRFPLRVAAARSCSSSAMSSTSGVRSYWPVIRSTIAATLPETPLYLPLFLGSFDICIAHVKASAKV